jgi:hypothetical protein
MSVSGAPASRNLKKATWEMNSLQRPRAFLPGGRALGVFLPKSLAKEPDKGQIDLGLCRRLHLPCLQGKDDNPGR